MACNVLYPDRMGNLEVRVRINKDQLATAKRSHGNSRAIENARRGVCIQVKRALVNKYGEAPSWIKWELLTIEEDAKIPAQDLKKGPSNGHQTSFDL